MESNLIDILGSVHTDTDNGQHTHISISGILSDTYSKHWNIRDTELTEFWNNYCNLVYENVDDKDAIIYMAEKHEIYIPVIAELTFKFDNDVNEDDDGKWEPYDDTFIKKFCYYLQQVIKEFFVVNHDDNNLVCAILESSHYNNDDNLLCFDLRFQFPYSVIESSFLNTIRQKVIKLLKNNNVMSNFERQPINDWDDIISSKTDSEPIVLYGSSYKPGHPKLKFQHILGEMTKEMIEDNYQVNALDYEEIFYFEAHTFVKNKCVEIEDFDIENKVKYLPFFLSLHYNNIRLKPVNPKINNKSTYSSSIVDKPSYIKKKSSNYEKNIDIADELLTLINEKRFLNEVFWNDIGKALYMADEGGQNGLASWIRYSRKSLHNFSNPPDFMINNGTLEESCGSTYNSFFDSNITIKSLAWYAKEDSPERYNNWHNCYVDLNAEKALTLTNTDVACNLYRVYWLDFTYNNKMWYHFNNGKWIEDVEALNFKNKISRDYANRFEKLRTSLCTKIQESDDDNFKSTNETKINKINALIKKLKDQTFKSQIVKESAEYFNNTQFFEYLDENSDILGIGNGILEIYKDVITFRTSKPEDYISNSTPTKYNDKYNWGQKDVRDCMKWMHEVFTEKSMMNHFLKFSASCLKGKNSDKIFPIFTGSGNNSKSMIVKLFEFTFGKKFCLKLDVTVLTAKKTNSSNATPELARTKGARIVFIDEPEDDVPLNKGIIKRFIGGDSFYTRALHSNGGDVNVSFKMVLTSNRVPTIPNADKAIKERVKIFPYDSTWMDNAPDDEETRIKNKTFKKDKFFEKKIPVLANAFLWIMVQYYPIYINEGLKDPQIIIDRTSEFWRDNDVYVDFFREKIKPVYNDRNELNHGAVIKLTELYSTFKDWYKENYNNKPPDKAVVRDYMSNILGPIKDPSKIQWTGYMMVGEDSNKTTFNNLTTKKYNVALTPNKLPPNNSPKPSNNLAQNNSPKLSYNLPIGTIAI